jgi:accessory colonization factor AcfC
LFSIGKQSVFKVLKENPENFKDLSNLADCDVDVSVTGARRLANDSKEGAL